MNQRALGRNPHSPAQLANLRQKHAYRGSVALVATVVQPIPRIRDQASTPSCVGQAVAAGVHALAGYDGSAIRLWVDARRRQGDLADPSTGTDVEYAFESLVGRGLEPYAVGDELLPLDEYTRLPDLASELAADDHREMADAKRYLVIGTVATQRLAIVSALQSGMAVLWATGVKDPFFSLRENEVVTAAHIGADYNGHELRIAGYDATSDEFLIQNSWGESWGGCDFQGITYPGCFRARVVDAIQCAWDTIVMEVAIPA